MPYHQCILYASYGLWGLLEIRCVADCLIATWVFTHSITLYNNQITYIFFCECIIFTYLKFVTYNQLLWLSEACAWPVVGEGYSGMWCTPPPSAKMATLCHEPGQKFEFLQGELGPKGPLLATLGSNMSTLWSSPSHSKFLVTFLSPCLCKCHPWWGLWISTHHGWYTTE